MDLSFTLFCNHEHFSICLWWIKAVQAWSLSGCTMSLCRRLLRFPNGKSLYLTRKYHYHFPFKAVPWTQNKQAKASQYTRHHGKRRLCWQVLFRCGHQHTLGSLFTLPLKTLETLSQECLPDLCWCMFSNSTLAVGPIFISN